MPLPCCPVAKSCWTFHDPMDCSMPGFPVLHYLPEFAQIHVHWIRDSNYLILWCPVLLLPSIFPSIRVFSSELALYIRWPKLKLQLQHQSFQWIFRVDFLQDCLVWSVCCPRDSQESSPTPQFKSISSLALSILCGPTLTSVHDY